MAACDTELGLHVQANILESLGRLDEAMARDADLLALKPRARHGDMFVRRAIKHVAAGEDAQAELLLTVCLHEMPRSSNQEQQYHLALRKTFENALRPQTMMAELLERRGTEEALAEATTLRDEVAQRVADYEAVRAAALDETRTAAAEAVRQWRDERSKAKGKKKQGGKGKSKKKKGKKGKAKGKGASSAAAIEEGLPHEPAGGAEAGEGAAAAEADHQQAQVVDSQPPDEEEEKEEEEKEAREECAICLQDLEFEDDEDPWGDEEGEVEALVVLRCGHRFHAICGDMWCAKCVDKGWGVTCPGCRAPYVLVRDE
jgi:hypothetical protein